jgi:beta-mannanase
MFFSFYDIASNLINDKQIKKVTFSTVVNVILIPCRLEYTAFFDELWWSRIDYNDFFSSAKIEISDFMIENPFTNLKDAKKMLYQPNSVYDDNDFYSGMYLFA